MASPNLPSTAWLSSKLTSNTIPFSLHGAGRKESYLHRRLMALPVWQDLSLFSLIQEFLLIKSLYSSSHVDVRFLKDLNVHSSPPLCLGRPCSAVSFIYGNWFIEWAWPWQIKCILSHYCRTANLPHGRIFHPLCVILGRFYIIRIQFYWEK